jgi:hypothetical protein
MSDEYNAVWPGTYGHFVDDDESRLSNRVDKPDEPSWEDIVLEQAIEETMLARADRKNGQL